MRYIYKYATTGVLEARCVKPVLVEYQGNRWPFMPFIWLEHSHDDKEQKDWTFVVYGTGDEIPYEAGAHVGSCKCGPFVWHVYGTQL